MSSSSCRLLVSNAYHSVYWYCLLNSYIDYGFPMTFGCWFFLPVLTVISSCIWLSEDSRCLLCSALVVGGKIILFKESTLKKCHDIYQARAGTTSKWSKVTLPSEPDGVSGYHVKCYKSYTAFSLTKSSSNSMMEVAEAAGIRLYNYTNNKVKIISYFIWKSNRQVLVFKIPNALPDRPPILHRHKGVLEFMRKFAGFARKSK